ncbi:phage holin family protein [Phormidium sp. CLA17]|uniref:phage holin family protein n=1 Tax=Leptolyngbya sp. Cla-17 TaxID=2803751 RepID=UPI0014928C3F|nr:phage holin family protein [Leptolyngbya sp. Cla-17]MBM0741535.1 phage holin family protein [Leptolyngbya sp. Cla-17]
MLNFILTWLAAALSLALTAHFVPGIKVDSFSAALIGAVILGFVNAIVRPLLVLFTLPFTILTLGLFLFVVNAIAFWLVAALTPGLSVSGFVPAFVGAIVLSIVSWLVNWGLQIVKPS